MPERKLRLPCALLPEGFAEDVLIEIDAAGYITSVAKGITGGEGSFIDGIAIPGLANIHSHAHQRAMAGLAEISGPGEDSFWTWREAMYRFALKIGPDELEAIAAQLYVEALKAGFTCIGEFQYLHHAPDGRPYDNPAELSLRCLQAATTAGIAITMLPTLYRFGGFGAQAPHEGQRRFINDMAGFMAIVAQLRKAIGKDKHAQLGISPHSLRAVTPELLSEAITEIDLIDPNCPIHMHVAEQRKEVEECFKFSGKRPVELLLTLQSLSARWCLIHSTHMNDEETDELAASGAIAGLCPMTEANLGDGIFNGQRFLAKGGRIAIGSDSQISVNPALDLRQLEYSQRLRHERRNVLAGGPRRSTGRRLFDLAAAGGAQALKQPQGAIAKGKRADIVVLDLEHPALIGRSGDAVIDSWIFSGGQTCVKHVFVGGRQLVQNGRHVREEQILDEFRTAVARLQA